MEDQVYCNFPLNKEVKEGLLKLTINESTLVCPLGETPQHTLYLSNLDQVVIFPIDTAYYFPSSYGGLGMEAIGKWKEVLGQLLVPYYFMAGRLSINHRETRVELVCNGKGALFISASSQLSLLEVDSIPQLNPSADLRDIVIHPTGISTFSQLPLTIVQVTHFRCGGFALGISTNHTLVDGSAASSFLSNYASLMRGGGMVTSPPYPDRTRLRARSPPQVDFEHHEYVHVPKEDLKFLKGDITEEFLVQVAGLRHPPSDKYAYKKFHVSTDMVQHLKHLAHHPCTTFEALSAWVWKCRTAAMDMNPSDTSAVLFAVDFRKIMHPPLPNGFAGNAVFSSCVRLSAEEVLTNPLSFLVEKVKEAKAKVTQDYLQSAIDFLEVHGRSGPVMAGGFYITSWSRLSFNILDFGWGPPSYGGPVISSIVEFVIIVPDGTSNNNISVTLALQHHHMANFEKLFHLQP